jgi:NAD(P)-dependent dehydrogenase (short-subunit alcohol dehydrogenase family)
MTRLDGQRVVAFGGASGAGLASAKLLASHGAEIVIAGRGASKLQTAAEDFPGKMVSTYEVDGKNVAAVESFFAEIGAFDHLVLTAGQTNRGGRFVEEITDAKFRETFDGKF